MKIAIIGSAPSSIRLAPVDDDSWEIWGCSPGAASVLQPRIDRIDRWFEIHPLQGVLGLGPEYLAFLRALKGKPVYVFEDIPGVDLNIPCPKEKLVEEFGPYFFTSTIAWMLGHAIMQKPTEIGLWGADMSATEEWGYQRAGCHYFIREAEARGIKITIPPQSDLAQPTMLYGATEADPMWIKLDVRREELRHRLRSEEAKHEESGRQMLYLRGALDDLEYMRNTWVVRR